MVLFYDPKDEKELAEVERMLHAAGIEYFLTEQPEPHLGPKQVQVAEEDLPTAEALLRGDPGNKTAGSEILPVGGGE